METKGFHIKSVRAFEPGKLETIWVFGGKAQLVEGKKVVHWCGTQTSGHYAQGIVNGLVDKASMGITTPNGHTVHSRKMNQGKGGCLASALQLDSANLFRSPTQSVNFLHNDSDCQQNVSAISSFMQR